MLDISTFGPTIALGTTDASPWFAPVVSRGRGAAFIDTGYLRALLDMDDARHPIAQAHFGATLETNFYTTNLVLAETVRQIAKHRTADFQVKKSMFDHCTNLVVDTTRIFVCAPDREFLFDAYRELDEHRQYEPKLDLCDLLSVAVLNYAKHNRVFGFDRHFAMLGGSLEPMASGVA